MLNSNIDLDTTLSPYIETQSPQSHPIATKLRIDPLEYPQLRGDDNAEGADGDKVEANPLHRQSIPAQKLYQRSSTISIFTEATAQAIRLLDVPVAIISTIAESGYHINSIAGIEKFARLSETDNLQDKLAGLEYCHDRAIKCNRGFAVTNCPEHPHLTTSVLCQEQGIQAYLGLPIITAAGDRLGAISILDFVPRQFSDRDLDLLQLVSRLVASEFERSYLSQAQLNRFMEDLRHQEIRLAAEYSQTVMTRGTSFPTKSLPVVPPIGLSTYLPTGIRSMSKIGGRQLVCPQVTGEIQLKLLTHLSQELRTPLTSVLGMTRVLQQEIYGGLSAKQTNYLKIIHDSGLQLVKIVDEIAELSAFDLHQNQLTLKSVDLELLCQLAFQRLEPLARQNHQRITLDFTNSNSISSLRQDRLWVLDLAKVRQIIYYLSLSLIQASASHHQIAIQLSKLTDRLQIQITTSDDRAVLVAFPPNDDAQPPLSANSLPLRSAITIEQRQTQEELQDLKAPKASPSLQTEIGQDLRISLGLSLSQTLAAMHGGTIQLTQDSCGYQLSLPLIQI